MSSSGADDPNYAARLAAETERFNRDVQVHDLPEIFHYWSNRYLRPLLEQIGVSNPDQFFAKYLARSAADLGITEPRFLSLGAGNCDTEVRVAKLLREAGLRGFEIHCFDISTDMLARGRELAAAEGVAEHIHTVEADVNRWQPELRYAGIMANQSLHHMIELEVLFDKVREMLVDGGLFVVSDMIGRNGHQRWPEALQLLKQFWAELPRSYRYNLQLQRQEDEYLDWDCSTEGFEGIRSQDILPLLLQRFHFEVSIAFGNIIDPFIDRSFGHHFDANRPIDRQRIDAIHAADEAAIRAGRIKPTHLMAVMSVNGAAEAYLAYGLDPSDAVRHPGDRHGIRLSRSRLQNRLRLLARRFKRRGAQFSQRHLPPALHRILLLLWREVRSFALAPRPLSSPPSGRLAENASEPGSGTGGDGAATSQVAPPAARPLPPSLDAGLPPGVSSMRTRGDHLRLAAEHDRRNAAGRDLAASLEAQRHPVHPGWCRLCRTDVDFVQHDLARDPVRGMDWREGLECQQCRLIARVRACLLLALDGFDPVGELYITEQLTPAYAWLHRSGYRVTGSEFLQGSKASGSMARHLRTLTGDRACALRHEDVTRLQFDAGRFGRVISMEVLEHVPDYRAALSEFFRVLAPGGRLMLTVPFAPDLETTQARAELGADGHVIHHFEPEYHRDPNNPEGCLSFHRFGWSLLHEIRALGFEDCAFVEPWNPAEGMLDGCGVLTARKN